MKLVQRSLPITNWMVLTSDGVPRRLEIDVITLNERQFKSGYAKCLKLFKISRKSFTLRIHRVVIEPTIH